MYYSNYTLKKKFRDYPILLITALLAEPDSNSEPPRFVKTIAGLDLIEGSPAKFEAVVTGKPEPVLQWLREGELIQPSTDYMVSSHTIRYA
jgi:hypothetical protein